MKHHKIHIQFKLVALLAFATIQSVSHAQTHSSIDGQSYRPISLEEFLGQVESTSGAITAKKLSADSVSAQKSYMSTPNINPSFTYSRGAYTGHQPYSTYVSPGSNTYSLSATIEGWGKRSARSAYNAAEIERTQADLDSTVKLMRGDAAFAYFDTLRLVKLYSSYQKTIDKLKTLKASSSSDTLLDAQKNTISDLKYFAYTMGAFVGNSSETLLEPTGNLEKINTRDFKVGTLLEQALSQRVDLIYLNQAVNSANAALELAKKNRNVNLSPSVWVAQTPPYSSSGTDYSFTSTYGFSVTVPIPTNLLFDNDLVQAVNDRDTLNAYLRDLKARVVAEVNQALMQYKLAKSKLEDEQKDYATSLKSNSNSTAASILFMRGKEAELIDAQINHAKALIYLLRVSGDYEVPKI